MVLVKASEADFRFPVLAYIPGGELTGFKDRLWLLGYERKLLKRGVYEGMVIIDASRRRWVVRNAYKVTIKTGPRLWFLWPFHESVFNRNEFDLEEVERIDLDELRELVCAAETTARQLTPPKKRQSEEEFERELAKIRRVKTVGGIFYMSGFQDSHGFWWARADRP